MSYFIKQNGQTHGPFTESQIENGLKTGKLSDTDLIAQNKEGPFEELWIAGSHLLQHTAVSPPLMNDPKTIQQPIVNKGLGKSHTRGKPQNSNTTKQKNEESSSNKTPIILWAAIICVALVACISFAVWFQYSSKSQERMEANQNIANAIAEANNWIATNKTLNYHDTKNSLEIALNNPVATETAEGLEKLNEVVSHNDKLRHEIKVEKADKAYVQATRYLNSGKGDLALTELKKYIANPLGMKKEEARTLISELEIALSDDITRDSLFAMTDAEFSQTKENFRIADDKISSESILLIRETKIKDVISSVEQHRRIEKIEALARKREEEAALAEALRKQRDLNTFDLELSEAIGAIQSEIDYYMLDTESGFQPDYKVEPKTSYDFVRAEVKDLKEIASIFLKLEEQASFYENVERAITAIETSDRNLAKEVGDKALSKAASYLQAADEHIEQKKKFWEEVRIARFIRIRGIKSKTNSATYQRTREHVEKLAEEARRNGDADGLFKYKQISGAITALQSGDTVLQGQFGQDQIKEAQNYINQFKNPSSAKAGDQQTSQKQVARVQGNAYESAKSFVEKMAEKAKRNGDADGLFKYKQISGAMTALQSGDTVLQSQFGQDQIKAAQNYINQFKNPSSAIAGNQQTSPKQVARVQGKAPELARAHVEELAKSARQNGDVDAFFEYKQISGAILALQSGDTALLNEVGSGAVTAARKYISQFEN